MAAEAFKFMALFQFLIKLYVIPYAFKVVFDDYISFSRHFVNFFSWKLKFNNNNKNQITERPKLRQRTSYSTGFI